jgi:hypothetical protein
MKNLKLKHVIILSLAVSINGCWCNNNKKDPTEEQQKPEKSAPHNPTLASSDKILIKILPINGTAIVAENVAKKKIIHFQLKNESKSSIELNRLRISIMTQTDPTDLSTKFSDKKDTVIVGEFCGDAVGFDKGFNLYVDLLPECNKAEFTLELIYDGKKLTNESSVQTFTWQKLNDTTMQLMTAVFGRNIDEVKRLLTSDKKNDIQSNAFSPYGGNNEILLYLPYAMTFGGDTSDPTPILELLLTYLDDMDVNALSNSHTNNMLELQIKARNDNFRVISLLVARGAQLSPNTNVLNQILESEYSEAKPGGGYHYEEEAKILLKKIAYILDHYPDLINKIDSSGSTPIHSAIDKMHSADAVKLLIDKGADITVKNSDGKTPKELAELFTDSYPGIIQVFQKKGL